MASGKQIAINKNEANLYAGVAAIVRVRPRGFAGVCPGFLSFSSGDSGMRFEHFVPVGFLLVAVCLGATMLGHHLADRPPEPESTPVQGGQGETIELAPEPVMEPQPAESDPVPDEPDEPREPGDFFGIPISD
ncbi:MAG: hypothetical protein WDZ31_06535 [Phycisphaeraceae bacterium]